MVRLPSEFRNDKADAQQDSSGSLIRKCVYTDGRMADINASDIIAIGHRLALPVKFAVRRAVSDSETACSLNCMRLHVARSLPKCCERWASLLSQIPSPLLLKLITSRLTSTSIDIVSYISRYYVISCCFMLFMCLFEIAIIICEFYIKVPSNAAHILIIWSKRANFLKWN